MFWAGLAIGCFLFDTGLPLLVCCLPEALPLTPPCVLPFLLFTENSQRIEPNDKLAKTTTQKHIYSNLSKKGIQHVKQKLHDSKCIQCTPNCFCANTQQIVSSLCNLRPFRNPISQCICHVSLAIIHLHSYLPPYLYVLKAPLQLQKSLGKLRAGAFVHQATQPSNSVRVCLE